jgi:YfiH family protein
VFAFEDRRGAVEVAFTDRFGGVSAGPFAELNLALPRPSVDGSDPVEPPEVVEENWRIVAEAMRRGGPPASLHGIRCMRQVHGAHVEVVEPSQPPPGEVEADALVTPRAGVVLAARAADCVPVLLADSERGVVAAVHAGRKGVVAGVVTNALGAMRGLGAAQLVAWIGPHACGRCYEVPAAMRDDVAAVVPEARSETSWGTPAVDLGAGVRAQLQAVPEVVEIVDVGRCTIEDPALYSFRRDGARAGRHAGIIWVRP